MAVSALDAYMHRLVVERVYWHWELPGKLADLGFSFSYALELTDALTEASKATPRNTRPRVALKRALRERLVRETFQRYDDVSVALGMAGLSGNWQAIGQALTPPLTSQQIKKRLNATVDRRNRIVHEGDYERLDRPQSARMNQIPQAEALEDVAFMGDLNRCYSRRRMTPSGSLDHPYDGRASQCSSASLRRSPVRPPVNESRPSSRACSATRPRLRVIVATSSSPTSHTARS